MEDTEARMEAVMVAPAHTSAMPMTRAAEVAAVRLGEAVSRRTASRPPGRIRRTGAPSAVMTGRETAGETRSRPSRSAPAPAPRTAPRQGRSASCQAARIPARPGPSRAAPAPVRARRGLSFAPEASRIASTGGVRAASREGRRAPTTVTSTPAPIDTATIRRVMGAPPSGRGMPQAPRPATSPRIRHAPARTPRTEPRIPMTRAWRSTVANTDVGEAPMARRRANSLWRRRTLMAKVFIMMKEPTNMARTTKTSRRVST